MSRYVDYDAIDYRNDKMHDKSSDFIDGVIYMAQRIEEAPSIDIPQWIPCSERLPSEVEYVIVSVLDDHGDTPWKYTTVAWLCNGVWISDNDILCGTAIAWMPLPKPWKGEGDERANIY